MNDDKGTILDHVGTSAFERGGVALSIGLLVVGAAVLALVLSGTVHRSSAPASSAVRAAATRVPGGGTSPAGAIVDQRPFSQQQADLARFRAVSVTHVPAGWEAGFYRLYDTAARTFGVNWLLLASIHKQETAFSTSPSTYHGLNFAHCCGGPMQFNVRNRPVSTWRRVKDSFRYAPRPRAYNHPTATHPSIYDDFDALMAASRLLASDGAGASLDGAAWRAAYDYYGHDATGVVYADQVLARAISWSQHGFCINCVLDPAMVAAVHAAYAPPPPPPPAHKAARPHRARVVAALGAAVRRGAARRGR